MGMMIVQTLYGREELGSADDLSPGQQPPSEQAAGQRSEFIHVDYYYLTKRRICMWVIIIIALIF